MGKGYDYFMVHVEAGRHLRLGVLTPAERCAWTHGVLAIAAKSELRGAFMVAERPATSADVALQANVPERVARAMLKKARESRLLEHDSDLGADWVRDFEQHNPEPKVDSTAAKRARDYRARQKAQREASRSVTRDGRNDHGGITPPEVEGEVEGTEERYASERAEVAAGVDAGVFHPKLLEVYDILAALGADKLEVESKAVDAACRAHPNEDPVAAAHVVASWVHSGQMQVRIASTLLNRALDKQRTEAEVRAKQVERAGQFPTRPGGGRKLSAQEQAAASLAEAERREQEERNAA